MTAAKPSTLAQEEVSLQVDRSESGERRWTLAGRLDVETTGAVWRRAMEELGATSEPLVVDASGLTYCDGAGAGLLVELRRRETRRGGSVEVRGLRSEFAPLLRAFEDLDEPGEEPKVSQRVWLMEEIGRGTARLTDDLVALVTFTGEMWSALFSAIRAPRSIRWRDVLVFVESAGVNALPIVAVVNLLMGLVMAFEASQALAIFGAQIFVADLVGISILRELGPLMTAILLAGRSGSAFAAELGTMKVNEELDALSTMGLEPLRFLAVPRVVSAVLVIPVLTLFAMLCGLIGGAIVYLSLGFPLVTYVLQIQSSVGVGDLIAGLVKAFVFAVLVAGVGCLRGMQTSTGASAVGISATRAVVSGIFLIIIADAAFSFLYYTLGV